MKRYNEKLMAVIERICLEKREDVKPVGPEHYEWFLNIPERGMEILVECIIREGVNVMNENILSGTWKSDEEIFDFVMMFLEMIAEGKVCIREEDYRLAFLKPIGKQPTEEEQAKIEEKIESFRPIIKKVMLKMLSDQAANRSESRRKNG